MTGQKRPTHRSHPRAHHPLRRLGRVLGRRWATIVFAVVAVAGLVLVSALVRGPKYTTTASVLVKPSINSSPSTADAAGAAPVDPAYLDSQVQAVTGQAVKQAILGELGQSPPVVARRQDNANVILITAASSDAASAAAIANAYADAYIAYRQAQDRDAVRAASAQLQARINDLQAQIDALQAEVNAATPDRTAQVRATVAPQVDNLVKQQEAFHQLGVFMVQGVTSSVGSELVGPAAVPSTPTSPKPVRDLALAVPAGLLLGLGGGFVLQRLDDTDRSLDGLARTLDGLARVGQIPVVPGWTNRRQALLVLHTDPTSGAAEAFRAVRTSLQRVSLERPMRTILVTSPSVGDGKTTVVANLGVALAELGHRVIVASCDLRAPRLHDFFGVGNDFGFTSAVMGERPVFAALQKVPNQPNLRVLAAGPAPTGPSGRFSAKRVGEVLAALQGLADIVVIDSPAVLAVPGTASLSRLVHVTLLIVSVGSATRDQVDRALATLGPVDGRLLATIYNGDAPKRRKAKP